jgi:hypothetical protein
VAGINCHFARIQAKFSGHGRHPVGFTGNGAIAQDAVLYAIGESLQRGRFLVRDNLVGFLDQGRRQHGGENGNDGQHPDHFDERESLPAHFRSDCGANIINFHSQLMEQAGVIRR